MKHGKKYQDSVKLIDHLNQYDPDQAAQLVVSTGKAKFDETVEALTPVTLTSRSAARSFCPMALAALSACWSSLRARRLMKPARLALTTSAIRT